MIDDNNKVPRDVAAPVGVDEELQPDVVHAGGSRESWTLIDVFSAMNQEFKANPELSLFVYSVSSHGIKLSVFFLRLSHRY